MWKLNLQNNSFYNEIPPEIGRLHRLQVLLLNNNTITPRTNDAFEKLRKLSLLQRLNIAIDVASALDYLHHHCQTPIVHCDLKPSNVLLDDKMIGHVSDFGLAKFLHSIIQDSSANQSSSIVVKGTIGYTPPGKYILHFLN